MSRWGMTIPLEGLPLSEQADVCRELEDLGYTDLWSSEGMSADGFTPLAVAAAVTSEVHLGIAIAPSFTRGPALLAQTGRPWPPPRPAASRSVSGRRPT